MSIENATVVAIDKSKSSLQAFRWTIDNLNTSNPIVILIHVKQRTIPNRDDSDHQLLFHPFRPYCAKKRVQLVEVIVEDADVTKGLIDYITRNKIRSIAVGLSPRNAISRRFKQQDIPGGLMKSSPPFCSVYVIGKGKLISTRKAQHVALVSLNTEDGGRENGGRYNGFISALEITDASSQKKCEDFIPYSDPSISSSITLDLATQSSKEIEAEMIRLRLELKKTKDLYSNACKEIMSVKKKADEAQRLVEEETIKRKQAEIKAQQEAMEKNRALIALAHNDARYRKYTIDEIETATDNFSDEMKVGEGGYGPVFKGLLDHTPVAIKLLRSDAAHGKRQFVQEVEVLSSMRHPNLVLLLGACPEYGCLVYEYMEYGSLEDRLLQKDNTPALSWRVRFKVAAEVATALLFLHQSKPEPLVHRDLKPANILLDHNYVSKISDVGLARLVPPSVADSVTQYHLTSAAGTFCYIDPEYQQTGKLTTKSDLYSLGITLLQLITSKPPIGLAHMVARSIQAGSFVDVLDSSIHDWPVDECLNFAKLALKCAELRKRDRPNLATVIIPELNRLRDLGNNVHVPQIKNDSV